MANNSFQIIHKRKGMKTLIRKIIWLQAYTAVSGIWKQEGRQYVPSGNSGKRKGGKHNTKIKLAKLAETLENFASWIQPKTVIFSDPNAPENKLALIAGRRYSRPARPFIMLWKINEAWNEIRQKVRRIILNYLANTSRGGKTGGKRVLDSIANEMQNMQKDRILSKKTDPNSIITTILKGINHPLYETGRLLESIRGRSKPNTTGRVANQEQKLKFLTQIDELINQLNRK